MTIEKFIKNNNLKLIMSDACSIEGKKSLLFTIMDGTSTLIFKIVSDTEITVIKKDDKNEEVFWKSR